jgi:hypothetical protein
MANPNEVNKHSGKKTPTRTAKEKKAFKKLKRQANQEAGDALSGHDSSK